MAEVTHAAASGALAPLLPLLRSDQAFTSLRDLRSVVVAVPEPARAFAIAGLAEASGRHPTVVAVPTNSEAERLAHDLAAYLGADQVDVCPAWETLPFERVSPSVETMGRRLRAMWRLTSGGRAGGGPAGAASGPTGAASGPTGAASGPAGTGPAGTGPAG